MNIMTLNYLDDSDDEDFLSISPSDVVHLYRPPKSYDAEKSKEGREQHKRILELAERQYTPTLFGDQPHIFPIDGYAIETEEPCTAWLSRTLRINTRPDAIIYTHNGFTIVEIKAAPQDTHFIQLMLTCMTYSISHDNAYVDGMLYFYGSTALTRFLFLQNGGRAYWDMGKRVCELAARINKPKRKKPSKQPPSPSQIKSRRFLAQAPRVSSFVDGNTTVNEGKEFNQKMDFLANLF